MPTWLLLAPPDFQTLQQPWIVRTIRTKSTKVGLDMFGHTILKYQSNCKRLKQLRYVLLNFTRSGKLISAIWWLIRLKKGTFLSLTTTWKASKSVKRRHWSGSFPSLIVTMGPKTFKKSLLSKWSVTLGNTYVCDMYESFTHYTLNVWWWTISRTGLAFKNNINPICVIFVNISFSGNSMMISYWTELKTDTNQ